MGPQNQRKMYYLDRLLAALGSRELPEEIQASTVSVVEGTAVEIVPLGASPQRPSFVAREAGRSVAPQLKGSGLSLLASQFV